MASNVQSHPEVSTASLVGGIVNDAQELFKSQLELFKAELKEDLKKTKEGATLATVGAGLGFVGLLILGLAVAHLLYWLTQAVDIWLWYAIVGGVFTGAGGALVYVVLTRVEKAKPLSETAAGLEENVEWQTKPTTRK
jgi:uncharacterized membrane protein YqjE